MNRATWMSSMLLAVALAFGIGLYTGVSERITGSVGAQGFSGFSVRGAGGQPDDVDFSKFWQAWNLLEENFVQTHGTSTSPTAEERLYGAIAGLTKSYGDPYTVFLPPKEAQQFQEDISGSFSGVGMELGVREEVLTVVAPLKGTPAERAGMQSGDIIVSIDGEPSRTMPVDEAVQRIRGERGTLVRLQVEREGAEELITVEIVRDTINIPLVNSFLRSDGIFVIELYSFSQTSPGLFRAALRQYFESGATKLLLDLRGNPGGYLEASVDIASYFLPVGEVVVTEDFAGKQNNVVHRSVGYNVFRGQDLSMVILVNQGSASASEILAGALQQHGVAQLVGGMTFGKGSVQQLLELGGGAELKITIARWLTPNGQSISDGGLEPDIKVERTLEDAQAGRDPQLEAAVEWLLQQ